MTSAAVELGRKLGYVGAGTAEFILVYRITAAIQRVALTVYLG